MFILPPIASIKQISKRAIGSTKIVGLEFIPDLEMILFTSGGF